MVENRWQIAIGAIILSVILLIGAFSIGVYIGRHGLSRDGLRYQPPEPGGAAAIAPADRPPGFPDRQPELIGKLRSITSKAMELATPEGVRIVILDQNTRISDNQNNTLEVSQLQRGDILAIFGTFSGDGGQQLKATLVIRLPEQVPPQPAQ